MQEGDGVTARSVTAEGYGRFLIDVFEEWVRRDVGEVYVQMFDTTLANWVGEMPGMCVHCETCGLALALEHTGDVYSCDHFVEPRYRLGNIAERHLLELVASEQQRAFGQAKADTLPALLPRLRRALRLPRRLPEGPLHDHPRRRARLNYLCPSFKPFFAHVASRWSRWRSCSRGPRALGDRPPVGPPTGAPCASSARPRGR